MVDVIAILHDASRRSLQCFLLSSCWKRADGRRIFHYLSSVRVLIERNGSLSHTADSPNHFEEHSLFHLANLCATAAEQVPFMERQLFSNKEIF